MLTLKNFSDVLDPELIEKAKMDFERNAFSAPKEEGPGFYTLTFPDGNESALEMDSRKRVEICNCSCENFDEETWEDDACYHIIAMLTALKYPIKEVMTVPAKKKKEPKKEPAKPKDPAEKLLFELEPAEVVEFVKQQLKKNKAFKSLFLVHFSNRNEDPQQYEEIVLNSINQVKGRRRSIMASDAGKIATLLKTLHQQAAKAEADGFFRLALQINMTLLKNLAPVFGILNSPSKNFDRFFEENLLLLEQIISNNTLPYEMREECFRELLAHYFNISEVLSSDFHIALFKILQQSAINAGMEDHVQKAFIARVKSLPYSGSSSYTWTSDYVTRVNLLTSLISLLSRDTKQLNVLIEVLEENKFLHMAFVMLVNSHLKANNVARARQLLNEYKRKPSIIIDAHRFWGLEDKIAELNILTFMSEGSKGEAELLATQMFKKSGYTRVELLKIIKEVVSEKKWAEKLKEYLRITAHMSAPPGTPVHPHLELLAFAGQYENLLAALEKINPRPEFWTRYTNLFYESLTENFIKAALTRARYDLTSSAGYMIPATVNLIKELEKMPGGPEAVREFFQELRDSKKVKPEIWQYLVGEDMVLE